MYFVNQGVPLDLDLNTSTTAIRLIAVAASSAVLPSRGPLTLSTEGGGMRGGGASIPAADSRGGEALEEDPLEIPSMTDLLSPERRGGPPAC